MIVTVTDLFDGVTPETSPVTITVIEGSATTGGGGGVTDHGALTGLADDDHTQYHTDARGDARYDALGDADAAQTAAEATAAAALTTHSADTTSIHGIADTAALVLTDDARLTNSRTPTAHATSHQDGGTDELALDGSQITTGTVADARVASTIARDSEVTTAANAAQAAAEATAASALTTHEADTTSVHGISNTANLETTTGAQTKVDTHVNDTGDAHDASAISFSPTGTIAATDVQAAIAEVASEAGGGETVTATKTTTYTAAASEIVPADSSGGAFTVTSPAHSAGRIFTVHKISTDLNAVTVSAASGTIDGAASYKLYARGAGVTLISDGTDWLALREVSSAWLSYTPAITGSTSNPNLGASGAISGKWRQNGRSIAVKIADLFSGAGLAAGSGDYRWSVPVNAVSVIAAYGPLGQASYFDASTNQMYSCQVLMDSTTASRVVINRHGGALVGAASPVVPAASDQHFLELLYEAA